MTDGYPSGIAISGSVTITRVAGGRVLGAGRIPANAAGKCKRAGGDWRLPHFQVRVILNAHGRQALSAPRPLRAAISFTGRNVPPLPWTITL